MEVTILCYQTISSQQKHYRKTLQKLYKHMEHVQYNVELLVVTHVSPSLEVL
jgi:hypothetical protein